MSRRGIVLFALMAVIWGIPYLLIRVAVEEVSPAVLVFARTGLGALILLPIVIGRGDLRSILREWRWVGAFAIIEMALPWVMVASAEQHIPSSTAALLIAGVPLVGAVIAMARPAGEAVGRTAIIGLFVGLAGVAAIVGIDSSPTDPIALVQMAIAVVCYAVGPVILARRLGHVSGMGVSAVSLAMTAALYLVPAATQLPAGPVGTDTLVALALLGIVCTAAALVLFAALIAEVGPVRATVITYVNPAVATVLGVAILGEPLTVGLVVGFVLVLVGSALATRPARPAEPAPVLVASEPA
ncbi:MAG: EamA family transporter [Chloroflexota bacterium]